MAEQTRLQSDIVSEARSAARWSTASTTETGPRDPLIEDYLDHLCAPLVGVATYPQRQELRAEWGAHLDALVEAYREAGHGPAGAVVEALKQFGDPQELAAEWLRKCTSTETGPEPLRPALLASLGSFTAATCLGWFLLWIMSLNPTDLSRDYSILFLPVTVGLPLLAAFLAWRLELRRNASTRDAGLGSLRSFAVTGCAALGLSTVAHYFSVKLSLGAALPMWLSFGAFLPLLAGFLSGFLARGRNALGTFYAVAVMTVAFTVVCSLLGYSDGVVMGFMQLCFWLPIGPPAAALGGWLRRRTDSQAARAPRRWSLR